MTIDLQLNTSVLLSYMLNMLLQAGGVADPVQQLLPADFIVPKKLYAVLD